MRKHLYRLVLVVCVVVFAYSALQLIKIYQTGQVVVKQVKELSKNIVEKEEGYEVNWDSLLEQNKDVVAWIALPDCDISFPVVQAKDNSFYLNHSFNGEENYLGAIFLAAENQNDFSDDNTIIYGHSVSGTGGMFTNLKKYKDLNFFNEHPIFYLFTPNGNYIAHVYTFSQIEADTDYYVTSFGDQREQYIQSFKNLSTFSNDIIVDGPLLTLSTCNLDYGDDSEQRYILTASLELSEDPIRLE